MKMKLTEEQAFKIVAKIERWLNVKVAEPEEWADFVMLDLINLEL